MHLYDLPDDPYEDDIAELRQEAQARRRFSNALARHPDPRDPDWPGDDGDLGDDDLDPDDPDGALEAMDPRHHSAGVALDSLEYAASDPRQLNLEWDGDAV